MMRSNGQTIENASICTDLERWRGSARFHIDFGTPGFCGRSAWPVRRVAVGRLALASIPVVGDRWHHRRGRLGSRVRLVARIQGAP